MTFPFWIPVGPWRVHPHLFFESLAYLVGFAVYLARRRQLGDHVPDSTRWSIVTAAAIGAVVGSRLLSWADALSGAIPQLSQLPQFLASKTAVGGVLGGWIAVEIEKRRLGIAERTGDLFALSLAVGFAIGRIGCFLSGLPDGTYGTATSLPWGVDLGDGVRRHPAALYESLFMIAIAVLLLRARPVVRRGALFQIFVFAYLSFRFAIDAIKPGASLALHLTAIQWACLAGLAYQARALAQTRFA
jgi:phosphatidylglycerol:prolipoprotein diacylglycerol transferase